MNDAVYTTTQCAVHPNTFGISRSGGVGKVLVVVEPTKL